MSRRFKLGEKYFGQRMYVGDLISSNIRFLGVKKYRIGLQHYTFIRLYINGVKKIIYIENLKNEFFSDQHVCNMNYIRSLKVEYIMDDSEEENEKIRSRSKTLQLKEIRN